MAKAAIVKETPDEAYAQVNENIEEQRTRPTDEEIAVRAYHIYLERGDAEGDPTDDWLRAERELTEAE